MAGFELPLKVDAEPGVQWNLRIVCDTSDRFYSRSEPWFEIELLREGKPVCTGPAHPLSCLQAVAGGRKTTVPTSYGILALSTSNSGLRVELHGSGDSTISGSAPFAGFLELVEQCARQNA